MSTESTDEKEILDAETITDSIFTKQTDGNFKVNLTYVLTSDQLADVIEAFQNDESGDDIVRAFDLLDAVKDWLRQ